MRIDSYVTKNPQHKKMELLRWCLRGRRVIKNLRNIKRNGQFISSFNEGLLYLLNRSSQINYNEILRLNRYCVLDKTIANQSPRLIFCFFRKIEKIILLFICWWYLVIFIFLIVRLLIEIRSANSFFACIILSWGVLQINLLFELLSILLSKSW